MLLSLLLACASRQAPAEAPVEAETPTTWVSLVMTDAEADLDLHGTWHHPGSSTRWHFVTDGDALVLGATTPDGAEIALSELVVEGGAVRFWSQEGDEKRHHTWLLNADGTCTVTTAGEGTWIAVRTESVR